MKIKDLTLRLSYSNTTATSRKPSNYLPSPQKHFYPMNVFESQKSFLTLSKKKSLEKIPDFLREILHKPPNASRPSSQGRQKARLNTSRIIKKRNSCSFSRAQSNNKRSYKEISESVERVLYKPTVFSINPRSKVTLFTLANCRSGSEARFLNRNENYVSSEVFKPKLRNRKVKYLVPEFKDARAKGLEKNNL